MWLMKLVPVPFPLTLNLSLSPINKPVLTSACVVSLPKNSCRVWKRTPEWKQPIGYFGVHSVHWPQTLLCSLSYLQVSFILNRLISGEKIHENSYGKIRSSKMCHLWFTTSGTVQWVHMMYCSVGKPVLRSRSRFFVGFLLLPSCPTDFFLFFKKCYISVLITKGNSLSIKIVGHYFDK